MIEDISKRTPFEVDNLTQSYLSLVNRGMKPTEKQIIALGDLASSQ
jgi:phage tail tape-measure protein